MRDAGCEKAGCEMRRPRGRSGGGGAFEKIAFANRVWERGGWGNPGSRICERDHEHEHEHEEEEEEEEERGRTLGSPPEKLETFGAGDVGGGSEVAGDVQDGAAHVEDAVDAGDACATRCDTNGSGRLLPAARTGASFAS